MELGTAEAAKWLKAIREPKSVLDKLSVKAGQRVAIVGLDDAGFHKDLEARGALLVDGSELDHLFWAVTSSDELKAARKLREQIKPTGALWILRPKGRKDLTEAQTRAAGKAAGLVDVKVVGFSETWSAEKYVIPVDRR